MPTAPGGGMFARWLGLFFLVLFSSGLRADVFGPYTYRVLETGGVEILKHEGTEPVVVVPSVIDTRPVVRIGPEAFKDHYELVDLTIPPGISSIPDGLVQSCSRLTRVSLPPGITAIGAYAFSYCPAMVELTIPEGVTTVGPWAFAWSGFSELSLPSSLTSLGARAFNGCGNLREIVVPEAVRELDEGTFAACASLATIALPTGLRSIGTDAFNACGNLARLVLPPGVEAIGTSAFEHSGLLELVIPDRVTTIGERGFFGCPRLKTITLGAGVRVLEPGVLSYCAVLETIGVAPGNPHYSSRDGVLFDKAQSLLVLCPEGKAGTYAVPAGVVAIADSAFAGCALLNTLTLPDSVVSIGESAFANCSGLVAIRLGTAVTSIGRGAFFQCSALPGIELPAGLSTVTDELFGGCLLLEQVVLPPAVTTVGRAAFFGCVRLATVILGEGVTSIGPSAFRSCPNLTRAYFRGDVPAAVAIDAFVGAAPDFAIHFLSSRTGFTTPTWLGYPAVRIDEAVWPAASWLLEYGYPHDAELDQDTDGDGVTLLLAYALNLDPHRNPAGALPEPQMTGDALSLTFYSGAAGTVYSVEQSMDLRDWTSDGVTVSPPDEGQLRRAFVPNTGPGRFLRLRVVESHPSP